MPCTRRRKVCTKRVPWMRPQCVSSTRCGSGRVCSAQGRGRVAGSFQRLDPGSGPRRVSNSQTESPSWVSAFSLLSLVNIPVAWVMIAVAP